MENNMLFMAGFPRAGTTILMNILAQNPLFHGTPTSGLVNSIIHVRDNWRTNENYNASEETYIYPKIKSMMKGMITGFYREQYQNNQIPIDKNRYWINQLDLLDDLYGPQVKFIFPIRNVIDCLISFEKMHRKSTVNIHGGKNKLSELTTVGRAEGLLSNEGVLGMPILGLREILYRKEWERLILVPFNDLLNHPEASLKRLYYQLDMEYFPHDITNIQQTIVEHDMFHGYAPNSLHKIREGEISPPAPRDLTIFDEKFINEIENERYKDITEFITVNTAPKQ